MERWDQHAQRFGSAGMSAFEQKVAEDLATLKKAATTSKAWDLIYKAVFVISVAVGTAVIAHEVRLTAIETSRFTDRDGMALETRVLQQFPSQQAWLREAIAELKTMMQRQDERLRNLERLVK